VLVVGFLSAHLDEEVGEPVWPWRPTINPIWSIAAFVVGGTSTPQFRQQNPNESENAIREI
jgi:hypothetical protein